MCGTGGRTAEGVRARIPSLLARRCRELRYCPRRRRPAPPHPPRSRTGSGPSPPPTPSSRFPRLHLLVRRSSCTALSATTRSPATPLGRPRHTGRGSRTSPAARSAAPRNWPGRLAPRARWAPARECRRRPRPRPRSRPSPCTRPCSPRPATGATVDGYTSRRPASAAVAGAAAGHGAARYRPADGQCVAWCSQSLSGFRSGGAPRPTEVSRSRGVPASRGGSGMRQERVAERPPHGLAGERSGRSGP